MSDDQDGQETAACPAGCWLETWRQTANDKGVRVLDTLRRGVQTAVEFLGGGFLTHRANGRLRERIRKQDLPPQEYYHQLLRLVYRMMFLLIAEDRDLLFSKDNPKDPNGTYMKYYSISRIRELSRKSKGTRHPDLWIQLGSTFQWLETGQPEIGVPAFGSDLFRDSFTKDLAGMKLLNTDLLKAVRRLTYTNMNGCLQRVNYRSLGVEELGSVYEALLEMHPLVTWSENGVPSFKLLTTAGNERKTSGSYYTPPELVDSLLDTALVPVMEARIKAAGTKEEKEKALLGMRVCDPACGSGHFLIGAARRMGKRLAKLRTNADEPSPSELQKGVRDVISHCIYGVDLNPMAVELCKVALWIESMNPGMALVFLNHRIRCGNSLLGTTPELLSGGIPDGAFTPIGNDDREYCKALKKRNKEELGRDGYQDLPFNDEDEEGRGHPEMDLAQEYALLDQMDNATKAGYEEKERFFEEISNSRQFRSEKLVADLWCAAFMWTKRHGHPECPTWSMVKSVQHDPDCLSEETMGELGRILAQYHFFHWHIEFADVFEGQNNGFDVVVGNPPWERIEMQKQEFFATRFPKIADAPNDALRKVMINDLKVRDPEAFAEFENTLYQAERESQYLHLSGAYPLCGRGKINTYAVFAELFRQKVAPFGRGGCIVQSGIATDSTTQVFFQDLVNRQSLASLYDFENKNIFTDVHRSTKFSLLTMVGQDAPVQEGTDFAFFNYAVKDLNDPKKHVNLSRDEIALVNPNTHTCPLLRRSADAELTKAIYRRVPIAIKEGKTIDDCLNPWGLKLKTMFNMATHSNLFMTREELEKEGYALEGNHFVKGNTQSDGEEDEYLPLYEAKMLHQFNHRHGDYRDLPKESKSTQLPQITPSKLGNASFTVFPRYWVSRKHTESKLPNNEGYLTGWRDITNSTNQRTIISSVIPATAAGDTVLLYFSVKKDRTVAYLPSVLNSYVADYVARQKLGGTHLTFFVFKQLAILPPEAFTPEILDFVRSRILELTYTAEDMRPFAKALGDNGEPFIWDERRRFIIRCELDALYFGLYFGWKEWSNATVYPETPKQLEELKRLFPAPVDAIDHVMGTFPIVKRQELEDQVKTDAMREFCQLSGNAAELGGMFPSHALIRKFFLDMVDLEGVAGYKSPLVPSPGVGSVRHV